jgi:hypothetical protein
MTPNDLIWRLPVRSEITNIVEFVIMRKLIFIPVLSIVISCGGSSSNDRTATRQSVKTDSVKSLITLAKANHNTVSRQKKSVVKNGIDVLKKLIGVWALSGDKNTTFEITKSAFYYPEHSSSYKYQVVQDSIKVKYDDYEGTFAFKFNGNDILTLTGDDGENVYRRMK